MSLESAIAVASIKGNKLSPQIGTSSKFKHWISVEDWRRCIDCAINHGKIWPIEYKPMPEPPIHRHCRCLIELMKTIMVGTATIKGVDGADWVIKNKGKLPDYYVSKEKAIKSGWKPGQALSKYVPDKSISAGVYKNLNGHLPQKTGRVWYEADINYNNGTRNDQRIVWSNDGLVFATYDHDNTFYEIK